MKKTLLAVCILLLCVAGASAQELPDAPSTVKAEQTRLVDRDFLITAGIYGAAIAADGATTVAWVGNGGRCPVEGGTPFLYGTHPNPGRVAGIMAAEFGLVALTSYEFKKHNVRIGRFQLWRLPMTLFTGTHAYGAINNVRSCR